jgi:hypothetical protein
MRVSILVVAMSLSLLLRTVRPGLRLGGLLPLIRLLLWRWPLLLWLAWRVLPNRRSRRRIWRVALLRRGRRHLSNGLGRAIEVELIIISHKIG